MTRSVQQLPHDRCPNLLPLVRQAAKLAGLPRMIDRQHLEQHDFRIQCSQPTILSFIGADHPLVEVQRRSAGDAMLVDLFGGHC